MGNKRKNWVTAIVDYFSSNSDEVKPIPIVTGIFKGDKTVKIGPTISRSLLRQMQVIQTKDDNRFQTVTDVERAALGIGVPILYALVVDEQGDYKTQMFTDEVKFTQKMEALDMFTRNMYKMHDCFRQNVFSDSMKENQDKYNEIVDRNLVEMGKIGLRRQAEEKLKQIKAGEKITNLMQCRSHGGKRK